MFILCLVFHVLWTCRNCTWLCKIVNCDLLFYLSIISMNKWFNFKSAFYYIMRYCVSFITLKHIYHYSIYLKHNFYTCYMLSKWKYRRGIFHVQRSQIAVDEKKRGKRNAKIIRFIIVRVAYHFENRAAMKMLIFYWK